MGDLRSVGWHGLETSGRANRSGTLGRPSVGASGPDEEAVSKEAQAPSVLPFCL